MESKLLDLPASLLISRMTYIPFKDVQSLCQTNKRIHDICTNPTYSNDWKKIIDYTYGHTKYYQDLIKAKDLKYDYILYTQLIDSLDPTVQAEIYRRQGDKESYQRVLQDKLTAYITNYIVDLDDETLSAFNRLFRKAIFIRADGGLQIVFDKVSDAHDLRMKLLDCFPKDFGVMIGNPSDSLIRAYRMFNIPDSVRHLIFYMVEGAIKYRNGEWIINHEKNEKWIRQNLEKLLSCRTTTE